MIIKRAVLEDVMTIANLAIQMWKLNTMEDKVVDK